MTLGGCWTSVGRTRHSIPPVLEGHCLESFAAGIEAWCLALDSSNLNGFVRPGEAKYEAKQAQTNKGGPFSL